MAPDRDAHLTAIYRRAAALRATRMRKLVGGSGALVLGTTAVLLALGLGSGDRERTDLAATDVPGTASTEAPLSTEAPSTEAPSTEAPSIEAPPALSDPVTLPTVTSEVPTSSAPPPSSGPSTNSPAITGPPPSRATTTTARVCRNSREARCGTFRYDPAPTNQPTTLRATPSAATVAAGTPVEMRVLATDPDSEIGSFNCTDGVDWSDTAMIPQPVCIPGCPPEGPRHGPWDPPPPKPGRYEVTSTHIYSRPGTYQVKVAVATAFCDFGPYRDGASTTVTINVTG